MTKCTGRMPQYLPPHVGRVLECRRNPPARRGMFEAHKFVRPEPVENERARTRGLQFEWVDWSTRRWDPEADCFQPICSR